MANDNTGRTLAVSVIGTGKTINAPSPTVTTTTAYYQEQTDPSYVSFGMPGDDTQNKTIDGMKSQKATDVKNIVLESLGGSSIHVVVNFHMLDSNDKIVCIPIYFGTAITVSYSVYRSKASVFNCGNNLIDGFAIGNKYVAGSIVKGVFRNDDFNGFLSKVKESLLAAIDITNLQSISDKKVVHSIMKDDLLTCDIILSYTSEYSGEVKNEIIYGANFMNNGQVASINDIITETTLSYIARSVKTMESSDEPSTMVSNTSTAVTATSLLFGE